VVESGDDAAVVDATVLDDPVLVDGPPLEPDPDTAA
jgi:hypothetical protein